jgi:hypothetical protein
MKVDERRKQECIKANCGLNKSRCLVKHGCDCIRLDGTRIPVQSSVSESFPLSVQDQSSGMKPYFAEGGKAYFEGDDL